MSSEDMNVVGGVHGLLLKLYAALSDSDTRTAALKCHDIIGDLGQECMLTQSENELVLQTSLLFSKEEGLLTFLKKTLTLDKFVDTRVEILSLVEKFLQRITTSVKSWTKTYAVDIRDACMIVYTKDKSAKCRVASLDLLIKVLYLTKDSSIAQDMKVGDIVNKFYSELCQKTKLPDTVLGKIYELLGVLGEVHPSEMINNSEKLYKAFLGELREQMTSLTKEPKLAVVAGCLKGITALMVNFTKSSEDDPKTSKDIFDFAMKTISPQMEMTRYAVTIAGLKLFAKHASQLSSNLIEHYKAVFEVISKLCGHINAEIKKTSYYALESFLKQVASLVAENVELHKSKLKFFMQKFCSIIKTMDSSHRELSIAIRGYGFFASPCKVVCPQDVDLMYVELIQRCKQMYLTETDGEDESVYQLPSFLDSIASVLIHLEKVPEVYTPVLERLMVVQIDSFPQYSSRMQPTCSRAILKVFVAMASKGPVLWNFISSVVHQGLIRVCSKPVRLPEEGRVQTRSNNNSTSSEVNSGRWKIPSCNDYLDLFRNLLDCDHLKDSGFLDGAFDVQNSYLKSLSRILYDELIRSILKIVEKLDLSLQKANMDEESSSVPVSQGQEDISGLVSPSSDPSAHLQPNKPKDFTAFINLVDFCSELLLKKHVEYFEQWVYPLSHELILQSIRSPLVSGFYKLLAVSMVVAKKIQYFQGVGPKRSKSVEIDPIKYTSFALFSKFGKEVSVRMKQYKDELLASSLMFVLSLHHDIVALDIKVYVPALKVALKLGLSHTPLADAALDALEVWSRRIPAESMQPFYRDILPHLDGYLKTADTNDNDEQSLERMSVSSGKEKGYGIMMKRLLKMSENLTMEENAPLAMVRRRVVRLLGHLGGQHNRNLVTASSDEEMMMKFVAWDTQQRLSFAVPFTDMKPVIYLDPFLPRIAELALSTSDRQTKVAACELLHSVVIYMIGKGSQIVEGENSPPMYNLHKRIFPVLLRLACDVDQVTRQLFEPLVMQLIHWFTSNKKFESQDTVAVLEAILDGLVDSEDSTLRDFCGRCLQEFVKWSIKQTSPKQQEKSPTNIKSVFKRIYSLALHPNGFKRLGAALAFNNIYRQFREENSLVEQFVFETLVIFVESMTLAHADEKSMGTLQQCSSSIDHLKRIIKCKADSLNQHNAKRRIPRGFPKDERVCLSDVVMWLLEQCGRPQTECRHKCMELFYEFVPLLPVKKSPSQWLEGVLMKQDEGFLVAKFEGGGLFSQPTLRDFSGPFSVRATLQWMDQFLAALDCYNTFIGLHIVKPHLILGSCEKSNFLKAVGWFLSTLATQGLETAESCFTVGQKTSFFSLSETDQYNYSKCTIIVRLFEFATMVLAKCQQDFWKVLEKDLFNPKFFELAALCVCQPSSVGFNMADLEVMMHLPEVCVHLLKALVASTYRTNLEGSISTKISNQSLEKLCSVDLYDSHTSHAEVEMLLSACKQIHKAGFLNSILQSQDQSYAKSLGSRLLMAVYRGIAPGEEKRALPSMDVRSRRLADGLLHLAFSLGGQSDQVVDLLLNTIMLSVPLSECHNRNFLSFSHGEYFYSLFQTTVNSELLSHINSTVPQLMKAATHNPSMVSVLLNGMLDHSFRERVVRKNHGSRLVELVLQRWDCLHPWWGTSASTPESKTATLVLLSKLLQIDSSVCSNPDHEAFRVVFTTFTTLIVDMTLPLNLKSQALIILPFFTTLPEGPLGELQRALEALVASHFPMQSDEFSRGSLQRNNYMECIRKFLDALELSQSPMLLKLLAEVLCRDKIHIMEDLFQTCFQKIARQSNPERQALLLSTVYGTFQQGDVPVPSMVQAMLERVLLPLASHCGPKALEDFFIANISTIMASLHSRFTKSSEAAFEAQLIKKNGCYKLMDLLYSRLPKEQIYSKNSQINQAFCDKGSTEGNELSKALIKSCFEAFTENMTGENQLLELRRQYHCAAYNCAMAVISCSFNETKFYQGFLFTEKPEKNQFIFENIINTERTYRFPIEVEVPLERKKKYIMVRKEVSEENRENPVYLSSQSYMADSSLSEEMSQFDFSTGVQSFSYSSQTAVGQKRTSRKREATETVEDVTVDLEMDELNQHECMATITTLLGHMQRNNITPTVEQGSVPSELPPWMKFLHGKLGNPATPLNIQLFISKLIINAEEVFRPYARFWLGPLLQLVVSGNNGGEGIHFMVVDLVVTVLSWISITSPKGNTRDEVLANRLLEFLMKNCFHTKRPVFRNNLEIIRIVVECWKDCLNVPYNIIYERFCGMDPVSKDNSVGLQLLGIILANNLPAYDPTCGIEYDRYIQSLSNNISFTRYQEIYCAAAEIIGLTLKNLTDNNLPHASLLELTASKIDDLKKKEMEDKFIISLNKVSKHFPPFIDRFVNSVFFLLPKLHGALKTHCLECLLSRAEVIPDIYRQLKTKGFTQIMEQRDEARQRVCLDILHKILALLKPQELQEFLGAVISFISHPSPACRERMYDILMWIQDNYSDAESMSDSTSEEVLNTAKEILLQGLVDENQGLQLYVRNFWCHEKRLPTVTLERMLVLLESLYSSRIERCFLSLATNLMLEMTSQSPDFKRNMFEYPLSECKFQDYVIDSNWRFRSTVMTPMFVDTQATQGQESLGPQQGAVMSGQLRATQTSLEFSQTQTPGRRTAFNWLTGSSVDTLGEYTQSSDTSSSLLGFGKKAERHSAAWRQTSEGFGTKRLSAPSDEDNSRSKAESERRADILRLRRRFLKDQEKVSLHFARKEMRQQKEKKDSIAEERLKRESQVTLYRSYRVGDLPDIQIQYSSLIAPLQALAQRDPTLAKQLFSSLFAGVLREMEDHKPTAEKKRIYEKLSSDLNKFLSKSTVFFPPFVACVQDMCHQHTELLQINPAVISFSCQASLQQPSGILLLEESLLQACSSQEPPTKRARTHKQIPPDTEKWIHLAKLYRSLGEYDVVRGIFGGKIGTKPITSTAVQAEARSDYAEAVTLYNEALNTEDWGGADPTDTEKDFWEIAALEAYNQLGEWKSLQYCSTVNIDENSPVNLDNMWNDSFFQETYLKYMMRSMVKQLQLGERNQALLSFVDSSMKVQERKNLLESQYSQELSLLYILQEDYDRAKYYANNCMQIFMQDYSSVDTLLNQSRLTVLQSVQALIEVQDFLQFITGDVSVKSLKNLIKLWTDRYPDVKMDPINVWDDVITSRCFFLDKICEKLNGTESMEVDEPTGDDNLNQLVQECKFAMKISMADSAWKQSNFPVATKLLKELHRDAKTQRSWLMRWVLSFTRFSHKRSLSQGPLEQISTTLKTIPLLDDLKADFQAASPKVLRDQNVLLGTSYHILASAVSKGSSVLETMDEDKVQRLAQLAGSPETINHAKIVVGLEQSALKLFSEAVKVADQELQSYSQDCMDTDGVAGAYMALANFCDKQLRKEEQSTETSAFPELLSLPVYVVESVLKALKLNSEEARLKFPRLLQIIELYPTETLDLMAKEMVDVPCWLLIGWISQMLALLDKPEAVAVQSIISQIAQCFPQALIYSFIISSESYEFEESVTGHRHREFVDRIKSVLDDGVTVQNFVDALQQLTNPEMLFKDWWDGVKNELEKPGFDQRMMQRLYDEMHSALGDHKAQGFGVFRKKFIQKFAKDVEKLFGPGGATLLKKRKDKSFLNEVDNLLESMRRTQKEPGNLKEYSPWLSNFKPDTLRHDLEVPGQYDGRSKPLPEYHAKITGFDERVKVMSSIRRPKRIVIRGDDEREHPFLVKGGEDLRQDQRIEQLFIVMNILLNQDTVCAQKHLQLRTYQVVPITTRIGLIEWMENTCTLRDFLSNSRTEEEQTVTLRPNEEYDKWLSRVSTSKVTGIRRFAEVYKKASRNDTINNFVKIEQLVPADLLKRAFLKMSTTPEAFLSLRSHFSTSHALLCVSHWILGIGDRHLSNFMINMETGGMIGIDFGHAFGSATQFIPVPELMPFRLTRQFVNLMQPMKETGLIQSVMVNSLRAYRNDPDLLLNTMDIFVKEPCLDWKNFEMKQLKKGGTWTETVDTKEIHWYPLQKVNFMRRKLEGANPAIITSEELRLGFEKDPAFKQMLSVALGSEEHNVRARLEPESLSVEKQVDCLLDQAMDRNILGRVWIGWEPWI